MEKKIVPIVIGLHIFALGLRFGTVLEHARLPDITERTDIITARDSLPYYYPVPRDSSVIRYVEVSVTIMVNETNIITLTANVNVPVGRKVYQEDRTMRS